MKTKILLFAVLMSFTAFAKTNQKIEQTVVNVYYFHSNVRCYTCKNMEKYSKEAVETYFKKEVESGKVKFKAINVDKKENKHYVKDYQLYTKTLIVSVTKQDKELKYKNLDKIWEYVRDKEKFVNYVKGKINESLKE